MGAEERPAIVRQKGQGRWVSQPQAIASRHGIGKRLINSGAPTHDGHRGQS